MQFTTSFIAAAAAFLPLIEAHMFLKAPEPYTAGKDNFPLDANGANFPCKFPGGVGSKQTGSVTWTPGSTESWEVMGSAVHGGGSCQISITYDNPPTKNSVFKVIQSYQGGCPMSIPGNNDQGGSSPEKGVPAFSVSVPVGLKAGEATFVWSWFNKVGNREMYMNCAPINIGGSESSDTFFNGLPDMFVANINNAPNNACTTKEGVDIVFPNPGSNVVNGPGNFGPACEGGPSTPTDGGSTNPPPAQSSGPALAPVDPPTVVTPPPMSTTMAVVPQPTMVTPPVNNSPPAQVGASCNPGSQSIMCGADKTMYTQCFSDGVARGPYAVPPGTVCDSTGMGGFMAKAAVSARHVHKVARYHRRNVINAYSFQA